MRKIVRDSAAVVVLAGAAIVGISGVASAGVVTVNPANLTPKTNQSDEPACVGFDSSPGHEAVIVGNRLVVVGGPYVNTVRNCIG